jgi:hypothetical protein
MAFDLAAGPRGSGDPNSASVIMPAVGTAPPTAAEASVAGGVASQLLLPPGVPMVWDDARRIYTPRYR